MKKVIIIASVLAVISPAASLAQSETPASQIDAPDAPAKKTLWQNITEGMTVEEVRNLYPEAQFRKKETIIRDYQVTPECEAVIDIRHEKGVVDSVRLRGGGSIGGRCADTVQAALGSRYGQPTTEAKEDGLGLFRRPSTLITWHRDGVTLRFKRFLDGGLGQRSWELIYSTYQEDIAL